MNPLLRFLAVALVLAAAGLAALAYYLARNPAPTPAPQVAQVKQEPAPERPIETVPVVVASRDLKAGDVLSASSLKVAQWPQAPADAYASAGPLLDKVLRFDLHEGQPLNSFLLAKGLSSYLDAEQRAVDIPVAAAADWRSIRPGDLVDIFFTLSKGGEVGITQSRLLMARVRLLAYGARSLDRPVVSGDEDKQAKAPTSAIVAVPQEQVNTLLLASSKGVLQLVLRSVQDASVPDQDLFPDRVPVLSARSDLGEEDRLRLQDPANLAFAGESLGDLAGAAPVAAPASPLDRGPSGTRRSGATVQVIRGNLSSTQPY
ncbi:Flp pilus assembly protein CpaB [Castellaniella daejeonensis]|uniref:Flp pilus assembly protein CpaB n=1 Tax=Castellaniella daejeonensis TaxID=659013 RepID=A0ABN0U3Y4_9BURK